MKTTQVDFRQYIESFKDFPKKGVLYWDFTPLLAAPDLILLLFRLQLRLARSVAAAAVDHETHDQHEDDEQNDVFGTHGGPFEKSGSTGSV